MIKVSNILKLRFFLFVFISCLVFSLSFIACSQYPARVSTIEGEDCAVVLSSEGAKYVCSEGSVEDYVEELSKTKESSKVDYSPTYDEESELSDLEKTLDLGLGLIDEEKAGFDEDLPAAQEELLDDFLEDVLSYETESGYLKKKIHAFDSQGLLLDVDEEVVAKKLDGRMIVDLDFKKVSDIIKKIRFNDVNSSKLHRLRVEPNLNSSITPFPSKDNFAIDPTSVDFTDATITFVATGSVLYKCKDWDFDSSSCPSVVRTCTGSGKNESCEIFGGWQKIMSLVPGKEYALLLTPDDPAFAQYSAAIGAPYCPGGESPCIATTSLLRSSDSRATPEPNQPNTVDACTDGTSGTYLTDESVENITVASLNGSYFRQGDTIDVTATFLCWDTASDNLNWVYTNNVASPSWSVKAFTDPCPTARPSFYTGTKTFVLDNINGTHAVRAINQYNGNTATTCGGGAYDDNDDLAFFVYTRKPPTVTNITPVANTTYDFNDNVSIEAFVEDDDSTVRYVQANISLPNGTIRIVNLSTKRIGEIQTNITVNGSWQTYAFDNSYDDPVVFASPLTFNNNRPAEIRIKNVGSTSVEIRAQEPTGDYPEQDNHSDEVPITLFILETGIHKLSNGEFIEVHKTLSTTTATGGSSTWTTYNYDLTWTATPVILSQVQTVNNERFVTTAKQNAGTASFQMSMEVAQDNTTSHPSEYIAWMAIKETGSTSNSLMDEILYSSVISADSIRGRDNGCYAAAHGLSQVPKGVSGMQFTRDGGNGGWARYCNDVNTWTSANTYWTIDEVDNGERAHTPERVAFIAFNNSGNITDSRYWVYDFDETSEGGRYNVSFIASDWPGNINDTETTYFIIPTYPNVTLINPSNASSSNNLTVNFVCNATDSLGLKNMTLYIWNSDGSLNQTNFSSASGTSYQFSEDITLGQGTFFWNCLAYNNYNNFAWADSNFTFTLSQVLPNVTIIQPTNGTQYNTGDIVLVEANVTSAGVIDSGTLQMEFPDGTYQNYSMITQRTEFIDGNMSSWLPQEQRGSDINDSYPSSWDTKDAYAINDEDYFYGRSDVWGYNSSGIDPNTNFYQMYFDYDQNSSTGFNYWGGWNYGYDFLVENGNLYNYSGVGGGWGWTLAKSVSYAVSTDNHSIEWAVSRDDIYMHPDSSVMDVLFSAGNGSVNDYIPSNQGTETINYSFFNSNNYRYWFNDTTQGGRYNITVYGEDTGGNIGTDNGWFTTIFSTTMSINTTKNPVENGEAFYYYADYEYEANGSDVLNANCTVQQLNSTDIRWHNGVDDADEILNSSNLYHATILDNVPALYIADTYTFQPYLAFNGTGNKNLRIWVTDDKDNWNSSQPYDDTINLTTNPELDSTTKLINKTLNTMLFTSSTNYTIILQCSDCNSTDFYRLGRDTDNFGHSYEAEGASVNWSDMALESYSHMVGILVRIKALPLTYNSTLSRYQIRAFQYLYSKASETYTYEVNCSKPAHEPQFNTSTITVANNYVPQPNITSITPDPASFNADDVTVTWTTDASGKAFGITTAYVNLSYPNSTFAAQYVGSPFIIPTSVLNVIGNYTLTAFAENSIGSNTSNRTFQVVYTAPRVVILSPLGDVIENYRSVTFAANVTSDDGIDRVYANITRPDSSNEEVTMYPLMQNDSFSDLSQWQNYTWHLSDGQQCTNEISGGKMRIHINGTGNETITKCGFYSNYVAYEDFNASIDFDISLINSGTMLVFKVIERADRDRGYAESISFQKLGINSRYIAASENAGNLTILNQVYTSDTSGTLGIQRAGNNFTMYFVNGSGRQEVASVVSNFSNGLYFQVYSQSITPGWYERNATLDNFVIKQNREDLFVANCYHTQLNGTYDVTMIANNTYGRINDTETTDYTVYYANTPPSVPLIIAPVPDDVLYGVYQIAWFPSIDFQGDSLEFNISLLYDNESLYKNIITKLPDVPSPLTYYFWNTSNFTNGRYKIKIRSYENETVDELYSESISLDTFILDKEAPIVYSIFPLGKTIDNTRYITVAINTTDPDGISTAIAEITLPNGTKTNISLGSGQQSDNFDDDTLGLYWHKDDSEVGPSQTCVVDIDSTISDKAFISLSGSGLPDYFSECSLMSNKTIAGDFDINVSFDLLGSLNELSSGVNLYIGEDIPVGNVTRMVILSYANYDPDGNAYYAYSQFNGTGEYSDIFAVDELTGKLRIKRTNNTFQTFFWNNSGNDWTEIPLPINNISELTKSMYVALQVESSYPYWNYINVSFDDLNIWSNNYTFGRFKSISSLGRHNISFYVNDSYGRYNDSETDFYITEEMNNPPTFPEILTPRPGDIVGGLYTITWLKSIDEDGDSLQYNVTLLNPDLSFNSTIASYLPGNQTSYLWDTTVHLDGVYSMAVTVFENETSQRYSTTAILEGDGNFTISNLKPTVDIIAPLDETFDENSSVIISVNASSQGGISTVIASVDTPNGTQRNITLDYGFAGDDFTNNETLGTIWKEVEDVAGSQICNVNINETYLNEGYVNLSGNGFPNTVGLCGLGSKKRIDGNLNMSITWNWESTELSADAGVVFALSETENASFSNRQVLVYYGNISGVGTATRIYANDNGTMEVITQIPKTIRNSTVRMERTGNNFTFYSCLIGGACQQIPVSRNVFNLSRALFIQIGVASLYPNYPTIESTVADVVVDADNYTFAGFDYTDQEGLYNVSIIATNNFGAINDTEKTNFTISYVNNPPSVPFILTPNDGDVWSFNNYVTWIQVVDPEGHSFQYNITLLNPDYSFNQSIVSNLGTSGALYDWDTTTIPDAVYSINVKVFENETAERLSNQNTLAGNFTINNDGPLVFDLVPVNGTTFTSGSSVTIGANVTDIVGVDTVYVNVTFPDLTIIRYDLNNTILDWYQYVFNQTTYDGIYKATFIANDTYGKINNTEFTFFIVPNDLPNITVNSPLNNSNYTKNIFNISINVTSSDPNNDSLCVKVFASNSTPIDENLSLLARVGACYLQSTETIIYNWTSPVTQPDDNTVMLLHFDLITELGENATHMYDYSGNGNNGSCTNPDCPSFVSGKIGACTSYETSEYVVVQDSSSLDGMSELTLEAWIKVNDISSFTILHKEDSYSLTIDGSGKVIFDIFNSNVSVASTSTVLIDSWHLIQATYNGSVMKIYFDGVPENTSSRTGNVPATASNLTIGVDADLGSNGFDGFIDQVVIHNESLEFPELRDHYRLEAGTWYWYVYASDFINHTQTGIYQININPSITLVNITPISGEDYHVNETVLFELNSSAALGIDSVVCNVTLPNSTLQSLLLTGSNTYYSNFTDLILRGRYNFSCRANDSINDETTQLTSYFDRTAPNNNLIDVVDVDYNYFEYSTSVLSNSSGVLAVRAPINDSKIEEVVVYQHDQNSYYSILMINDTTGDAAEFQATYMIDASRINMSRVNITVNSSGYHLFKCTNFNTTTLECRDDDNYTMVRAGLVEGENYTIVLNATDPIFGETLQGPLNTSDAFIREGAADSNFGGLNRIRVGKGGNNNQIRGIIDFNLSYIPSDATILSATLSLFFYQIPLGDDTGNRTHNLYKVQQSPARNWTELNVTWNDYFSGQAWTNPGGDYNAVPTANVTFDSSSLNSWIDYDVTVDVQNFIQNASTNFGWIIKDSDESTTQIRRDYRSSEYGTNTSQRPRLIISYNQPPNISAVILNSTFGTNLTTENLTRYIINETDPDGDPIKNITNWYVNNNSLTVLNMPFEATGGNESTWSKDYSDYNNDGDVSNALWLRNGGFDGWGAYNFTGTESINISHSDSLNITDEITMEAWVYPTSFVSSGIIYAKPHTAFANPYVLYGIGYSTNNNFDIALADGSTQRNCPTSANSVQLNMWQHIIATFNGTDANIYINGRLNSSCSFTEFSIANNAQPIYLGYYPFGSDAYNYEGLLDEVRIYNRSLSSEQIFALYQNRTDLIVSSETEGGEVWNVCVWPNDNYQNGARVCSNNLKIENQKPTIQQVILNSTFGTNASYENLTRYLINVTDPEGSPVKNITNWYVDDASMTLLNMPFEANEGYENVSTKDYSKFQNGTVENGAVWNLTGGYDGWGAYHFDGSDQYIEVAENDVHDIKTGTKMTIMFWYNHDATASQSMIAKSPAGLGANGFGWDVRLSVTDAPVFFYNNGSSSLSSLSSGINTNAGNWYHVAVTVDRITEFVKFYLNGTEVANKTIDRSGTWANAQNLNIGSRGDGGADFNGTIDEVYIFNRTLSSEQIREYYNNRTDLIVNQETFPGETWKACVTPNDNYQDGDEVCSNNLTIISNNPPSISQVVLNSTFGTNLTTENLTRYVINETDPDGDLVKNITNWYVNNNSLTVLNMPFEATGGNESIWTKDYSDYNNDGDVSNALWLRNGGFDGWGAYDFDGSSAYIDVPDDTSLRITDEMTIISWIKPRTTSPIAQFIIEKGQDDDDNYGFLLFGDELYFEFNGSAGNYQSFQTADANINTNIWTHVAVAVNSSAIRFYVDGVLNSSSALTETIVPKNYDLLIGRQNFGTNNFYFNGSMDELEIFDRALSSEQIFALYQNRTDLIVSQETDYNDVWKACVTPNDNYQDGSGVCSNNLTIKSETLGPVIVLNSPLNHSITNATDINFNWTAYDDNPPITCNLYIDGILNQSAIPTNNGTYTNYTVQGFSDGDYNWSLTCSDVYSNLNSSETWIFTIDTTKPSIYFIPPTPPSGTVQQSNCTTLNISVSDENLDTTVLYWNGSERFLLFGDHRREVFIDNSANNESLSDYQIYLEIPLYSGMNSDFSDLRFTNHNHTQELDFCILEYTDPAHVWLKVDHIPANSNTSVWMHYGNEFATSKSNCVSTFSYDYLYPSKYVVSALNANYNLKVQAGLDNTTIRNDDSGTTVNLDQGDIFTFSSVNLSSTTSFSSNKPYCAAYDASSATDTLVPVSFSGTQFAYYANRNNPRIDLLAIEGGANVTVSLYTAAGVFVSSSSFDIPDGTHYNYSFANSQNFIVESNNPLMATYVAETAGADTDSFVMLPTRYELFGVVSNSFYVTAVENNTNVLAYYSDNTTESRNLDRGESFNFNNGAGSQGTGNVVRVVADKPIGGHQYADGDGSEMTAGWSRTEIGTCAGTPLAAEYVVLVCPVPDTTIYQYNSSGSLVDVQECSNVLNSSFPGKYRYTSIPAGTTFFASAGKLVYIMLETSASNDEQNGCGLVQTRKYSYPEPSYSFGSETINNTFFQICNLSEGTYTYYACANDSASNRNCTENRTLTISKNSPPNISRVILNSTFNTNNTLENLTRYIINLTDVDGDPVKNITNWYVNDTSMTLLNMPFEANDGYENVSTKDYTNFGNNGTVNSAAWLSNGGFDGWGAYDFDGINDYINISNDPSLNPTDISIEMWIFPKTWTHTATAIAFVTKRTAFNNGYFIFYYRTTNTLTFDWGGNANRWNTGYAPPLNKWSHIVLTRNSSSRTLYVNGSYFSSTGSAGTSATSTSQLYIGRNSVASDYHFNGTIDEVRFYNRSLSSEQVAELYKNRTDLIVSQETKRFETWKACVTPNDNTLDGREVCSNNLTICTCCPLLNRNWSIDYDEVCDNVVRTTGTGRIEIRPSGTLTLINSANITGREIEVEASGDRLFINRGCRLILT